MFWDQIHHVLRTFYGTSLSTLLNRYIIQIVHSSLIPFIFSVPENASFFGVCSGKGSNAVISYIKFFSKYGIGETKLDMHCDNCSTR